MTLDNIMSPVTVVFDWMRNSTFYLGQFPFTFWDLFVWGLLASVIIGFLRKI